MSDYTCPADLLPAGHADKENSLLYLSSAKTNNTVSHLLHKSHSAPLIHFCLSLYSLLSFLGIKQHTKSLRE